MKRTVYTYENRQKHGLLWLVYSRMNCAWFLMWGDSGYNAPLRILNSLEEAECEVRSLLNKAEKVTQWL